MGTLLPRPAARDLDVARFYAVHAPIAGAEATLQTRVRSSFEPELAAAVFALAFAFRNPVPTLLGYDNEAAVQVAFGEATQTEPSMLSHAGIAVSHMLRQQPSFTLTRTLAMFSMIWPIALPSTLPPRRRTPRFRKTSTWLVSRGFCPGWALLPTCARTYHALERKA